VHEHEVGNKEVETHLGNVPGMAVEKPKFTDSDN
jgi:hypothetical protein